MCTPISHHIQPQWRQGVPCTRRSVAQIQMVVKHGLIEPIAIYHNTMTRLPLPKDRRYKTGTKRIQIRQDHPDEFVTYWGVSGRPLGVDTVQANSSLKALVIWLRSVLSGPIVAVCRVRGHTEIITQTSDWGSPPLVIRRTSIRFQRHVVPIKRATVPIATAGPDVLGNTVNAYVSSKHALVPDGCFKYQHSSQAAATQPQGSCSEWK